MTYLIFSRPRVPTLVSRLIQWLTKSQVSHCAFAYDDKDFGCLMVMEADWYGFGVVPASRWGQSNLEHAVFALSIDSGIGVVAREYLGTRYDYGGALGTLFGMVGRILKRRLKNPLHSARAVFCSEAAVLALQASNFPGAETLKAADTTPGDLLNFLQEWRRRGMPDNNARP